MYALAPSSPAPPAKPPTAKRGPRRTTLEQVVAAAEAGLLEPYASGRWWRLTAPKSELATFMAVSRSSLSGRIAVLVSHGLASRQGRALLINLDQISRLLSDGVGYNATSARVRRLMEGSFSEMPSAGGTAQFVDGEGSPASLADVARVAGFTSRGTAAYHLRKLAEAAECASGARRPGTDAAGLPVASPESSTYEGDRSKGQSGALSATSEGAHCLQGPSGQPEIARHQPEIARHQPEIARHQPELTARHQPEIARHQPEIARHQPELTGPAVGDQPEIARHQPEIARHQPELTGPAVGDQPEIARHQPELGRSEAINEPLSLPYDDAQTPRLGPFDTEIARHQPEIARHQPEITPHDHEMSLILKSPHTHAHATETRVHDPPGVTLDEMTSLLAPLIQAAEARGMRPVNATAAHNSAAGRTAEEIRYAVGLMCEHADTRAIKNIGGVFVAALKKNNPEYFPRQGSHIVQPLPFEAAGDGGRRDPPRTVQPPRRPPRTVQPPRQPPRDAWTPDETATRLKDLRRGLPGAR